MDTSIEILPVRIADHYQVVATMMHELHKHEYALFDKTAQWPDIEANYMKHVMHMQEEYEGLCLVAYVSNVPSGFIFGFVEEQDDSRFEIYEGKQLYVSDGYVASEMRGKGIYRKLNEELQKHFIAKGVKRMVRMTLVNNTRMRQFLESDGYTVTRIMYEKWL